jgi:hypothetical protein
MANEIKRTPRFRLSSSSVFEKGADMEGNQGEGSYFAVALFDEDSDLKAMATEVKAAAAKKFGDKLPAGFKIPFRDQADKEGKDGFIPGNKFITMKNYYTKPRVVGPDRMPLEPKDLYAGCYCVATYSAHAFDKAGSKGVSIRLHDIQKVAEGEPLSNAPSIEDSFEALGDSDPFAEVL